MSIHQISASISSSTVRVKRVDISAERCGFMWRGLYLQMTAGEIYPVYFPIIPTETGDLKINITVISTGPSDAVIRYLKVEVSIT